MEFNIDTNRIIGVVDHKLGEVSARIKVLAYTNQRNDIKILSEYQTRELFPPKGFVFEPGFFINNSFNEKDFISFSIIENEHSDPDKDIYRINDRKPVKKFGIDARHINGFSKKGYSTNLMLVHVDANDNQTNGDFYGITEKYLIGKLRLHEGKITPAQNNRIKVWDIEDFKFVEYNKTTRLLEEPAGESLLLDCMNDKQLFEWFRDALKKIEPKYVDLLDKKSKWRKEIPKLFTEAENERNDVDKIRIERINEIFRNIELSLSDIKVLVEKSDSLRDTFNRAIENHKEELRLGYTNKLKEYQSEFNKQKELIDIKLTALQNTKKEKEAILNSLKKEIENTTQKIEEITQNKERILTDFSIIKDVLDINSRTKKNTTLSNSFIIENIEKPENSNTFSTRDELISELKYQLNTHQIFPNFAYPLLDVVTLYKGSFIKDIRLGIAFVKAIKNTKYIIQQVEPDWLHFKDFWENGLGTIWQSAHNNPNILHFLLLEDINMSSPECYARPLFDMINGIRKHIPFGGNAYPDNLKILATTTSVSDPEIGLPLIKQTFTGWGAIGFKGDIFKKSDGEYTSTNEFAESISLKKFQPDEFEIGNIKLGVKEEFNNLFESE